MVEKANPTKRLASAEKSKKSARSLTAEPLALKSSKRVQDNDMESESDESENEEEDEDEDGDEEDGEDEEEGGEEGEEEEVTAPTHKYEPPRDFAPLSSDSVPNSNPFSARNLQGKELWFITTPIQVPFSKVKAMSMQDVMEEAPILETKSGRKYCLKTIGDIKEDGVVVMTPDSDGLYRAAEKPIARSLQLMESLPRLKNLSKHGVPVAKPVRLQPEGLRMRYRPFGAVGNVEDDATAAVDAMDIDQEIPRVEAETPERRKKRPKSDPGKKKHRSKGKEVET